MLKEARAHDHDTRPSAQARSEQVDKEGAGRRILQFRPPHLPGLSVFPAHEAHGEGRRPAYHRSRRDGVLMYVANTTYMSTPWVVPWMHTQLGAAGSSAVGTAAGLKALMRKGKIKDEPINVIAFCGDGGGADMGLAAISAALTDVEYNLLIFLYDNESYANTDIQTSGQTPWGAVTTFSPPGKKHRIMQRRWKKNVPGMLAAGHPDTKYIASGTPAIPVDMMDKVRAALSAGGPTYMHVLYPCPKVWHYYPELANERGKLAIETGIYPLYEIKEGLCKLTGVTK